MFGKKIQRGNFGLARVEPASSPLELRKHHSPDTFMPFSEAIKLTVKRKAHFACCLCRNVGIELHHIIPQSDGGPDTEDNAAPLCPSCHEAYGANPTKRKFIREARDFWYDVCAERYAGDASRVDALQAVLRALPTKADMELLVSRAVTATASTILQQVSPAREAVLPELLTAPVAALTLKAYLRFMYGNLTHCGPDATSRLVTDLRCIGHVSIASLHDLLSETRYVTAEFVQDHRDAGDSMDERTDEYPIRLFLAVMDANYCKKFHTAVYAKFRDKNWPRSELKPDEL